MYVKVSEDQLRRLILEEIEKCSPCTFPDLRRRIEERLGGPVDPRIARRVFASLVKEGKINKEPRYEERRFKFTS